MTTKGLTLVRGRDEIHVPGNQQILPSLAEELTHIFDIFNLQIVAFISEAQVLFLPSHDVSLKERLTFAHAFNLLKTKLLVPDVQLRQIS